MEPRFEKIANEHTLNIDRDGVCRSGEVPYNVFNVVDENEATEKLRLHLYGNSLDVPLWNGMALSSIEIDERLNETAFRVNAVYEYDLLADSEFDDDDDNPEITVNIGQINVVRKEAIKRIAVSPGAPAGLISEKGINTNVQGEPEGVEVPVGYTTRSEVYYIKAKKLDTEYENTLTDLVGKVNSVAFRGRPAGEVKFDGATYTFKKGQREKVKVTFNFSISKNVQKHPIGKWTLTKRGWDYAWVKYAEPDEENKKFNVPKYAVIDQTLEYADFGRLKIGK